MKNPYGEYSDFRFKRALSVYTRSAEVYGHFYNYLIMGFHPGSFFAGVFSNAPFCDVIQHAHPVLEVQDLKLISSMCRNLMPRESRNLEKWISLSVEERRDHLESCGLVFSVETEVELTLSRELHIYRIDFD